MRWTTDTPTVEGLYWVKRGANAPILVGLELSFPERGFSVCHVGTDQLDWISDNQGASWYGPITPPSDDLVQMDRETMMPLAAACGDMIEGKPASKNPWHELHDACWSALGVEGDDGSVSQNIPKKQL